MNIPLNVLVEAAECFEQCRNAEGRDFTTEEFMRFMRSSSEFRALVQQLVRQLKVEVTA